MLTREITFYCQQGLSITQAKQLNRLAGMFKSTIRCANLTRRQTVAASNQLSLLTLATQPGDLCQLQIEGCDAELAHMAFTCWCGELGQPLVRSRTAALAELRLANALPDYHFALRQLAHSPEPQTKAEALEHLIDLLPAELVSNRAALEEAISRREQVSATIIRPGLAMPHVLNEGISQPALTLLNCKEPIEWGSQIGPVQTIILLAVPVGSGRETLRPLTRLAQAMIDDVVSHALLLAGSAPARQAIVIESLLS
ncbi:PTS sugar transporter subunit IIA [Aeromonas sp. DNP9]|uniref:PTS sugar transporter subunit IIA n=1 Tax=Aeromonas sp. DNP9 TaxID=1535548 RepID=UPI00084A7E22|nr:PTS sugar transporter subunit IIA [Aeromonas sp. DNP9]OEC42013.1 PTS fructose transporter subunit IIA [Aeromonas sp. DNP9]